MSRHDRGDDLADRGAVQCLKSLQLANEAKVEMAVGLLVQIQQRAVRLAADGCDDAGMATDIAEEENVKEKVAEVVEWILTGTAANDASLADKTATWKHRGETPTVAA